MHFKKEKILANEFENLDGFFDLPLRHLATELLFRSFSSDDSVLQITEPDLCATYLSKLDLYFLFKATAVPQTPLPTMQSLSALQLNQIFSALAYFFNIRLPPVSGGCRVS